MGKIGVTLAAMMLLSMAGSDALGHGRGRHGVWPASLTPRRFRLPKAQRRQYVRLVKRAKRDARPLVVAAALGLSASAGFAHFLHTVLPMDLSALPLPFAIGKWVLAGGMVGTLAAVGCALYSHHCIVEQAKTEAYDYVRSAAGGLPRLPGSEHAPAVAGAPSGETRSLAPSPM